MSASLLIRGLSYSMVGALLGIVAAAPASAALIYAQWTFEGSQPTSAGPHAPEIGVGSAFVVHQGTSTYSSPTGNGSEHSFSSTGWAVGDYLQFNYPQEVTGDAAGFHMRFRFDITSNAADPPVFVLQRSRNGAAFTTISSSSVVKSDAPPNSPRNSSTRQTVYSHFHSQFVSANTISYRLLCNDAPFPISQDANVRIDNVILDLVPEPGTGLLATCALVGLASLRRRAESA
jgi:hypothetical protein